MRRGALLTARDAFPRLCGAGGRSCRPQGFPDGAAGCSRDLETGRPLHGEGEVAMAVIGNPKGMTARYAATGRICRR